MACTAPHRRTAVCTTCTIRLVESAYRRSPWFRLIREPLKVAMRFLGWIYRIDPALYEVRSPGCYSCLRFTKTALKEKSALFRWLNGWVNPLFDRRLEHIVGSDAVRQAQAAARAPMAGEPAEEQTAAVVLTVTHR